MSTAADPSQETEEVVDPVVEEVQDTEVDYGDNVDHFSPPETEESETAEPSPEPDAEPEAPEVAESEVVDFPDYLLNDAGITAEQARSQFAGPEQLQKSVDAYYRNLLAGAQPQQQEQQTGDQPDPYALPPITVKLPEAFQDDDETKVIAQAIADSVREQTSAHYGSLLQQRDQLLSNMLAERQQQQADAYKQEFESGLEKLGDEWTQVFGKGDGKALPVNSAIIQNRIALDRAASRIEHDRSSQGLPRLSIDDRLRLAARVAFPQQHDALVAKAVTGKKTARASQFTNPPTNVKGQKLSPEQRAVQAVDQLAAKFKIPLGNSGPSDYE